MASRPIFGNRWAWMVRRARGPVLIVEDNGATREALEAVLRFKGYDTVAADDGLDALAYLRRGGAPSVIVLDLRMPNMDGVAFQRALRADPTWATIPIVVFSGLLPTEPDGITAIVPKGASPDVLLAAITAACAGTVRVG
jgi:CheY-like chemotaxis protein